MAEQAEKTEPVLEQVLERLKELEKRIEALEKREALADSRDRSEERPVHEEGRKSKIENRKAEEVTQEGAINPSLHGETQGPRCKLGTWGTHERRETQDPGSKSEPGAPAREEKPKTQVQEANLGHPQENPSAHPHTPRVGHPAGATSVVPVVGKAVLAIAGAYLLRAIAESGVVPRWMMLVAGIAYAGVWLVWAARRDFPGPAHESPRRASAQRGAGLDGAGTHKPR